MLLGALATLVALTLPATGAGGRGPSGFKTSQPPMLTPVASGVEVDPIINVGESVGGYTFDSIPDGIALARVRAATSGTRTAMTPRSG